MIGLYLLINLVTSMKKPLKSKRLSIVILNYNTESLLRDCLASIPNNSEYEIVVVDNASTDNSVNMVKKEFSSVKLILNKENVGYTRGNNAAKGKVAGEYVLFLNSDTKVDKDTLPAMLKLMDEHPNAGASTCLTLLPNGKLYYACHRGFPTPWNSFCYFSGLAKAFPKSKTFAGYTATYLPINTLHEIDACSGTFLLIRKKLLDQIGWFDEDYFSYGEDLEMCYQVKERGYKILFNPDVKITHYWGASSGLKSTSKHVTNADNSNSQKWNNARYKAMEIFYDKHYREHYPELFRTFILFSIKLAQQLRKKSD